MTVTARKHALLHRISPKLRQLIGLYFLELAVILSWTLLLGTVFNFISGNWLILLPLSYLLSVTMLAWLERARTGSRGQCPLEACGLAEISLDGSRPSEWQTLRRLIMTPPSLLLLGIGLIPIPGSGKTILQIISNSRIVPLDTDMDPRHDQEIFVTRKKALMKVISYTMISLMVAAIIIFVPPDRVVDSAGGRIASLHGFTEKERELLASYLEMRALYPDSLEFHVRLASLYYRNNMEEDLVHELEEIRRLDPEHSILILEEDLSITMQDLMADTDSLSDDSITASVQEVIPPAVDIPAIDSVTPDSVSLDLRLVASDSTAAPEDSISISDSTEVNVPVEADSLILPAAQDSLPEVEIPESLPDEIFPEEIPDSTSTENTASTVSEDSTESAPADPQLEPEGT